MRIGICDDLPAERAVLKELLLEQSSAFIILEYTSGEALLAGLAGGDVLDLLFLDICMGGKNGIAVAEEIRQRDEELPILFLTSAPEYAVESYRVQAQDYLLKPVEPQLLYRAFNRQIARIAKRKTRILFQATTGVVQIPVAEIVYFELVARKLMLVQQDGTTLEGTQTIQAMADILQQYPQFVRPHRSYLVNLNHVKKMGRDGLYTESGAFVPIARGNMASIKAEYMNQMLAE